MASNGYTPATGDGFYFDRDGLGTSGFAETLDTTGLTEYLGFPPSVQVVPSRFYVCDH